MSAAPRIVAIVPAAGTGARFGGAVPKQYALLGGRPLLAHAVERLAALAPARIVVALAPDDRHFATMADDVPGVLVLRCGGATRAATVRAALAALAGQCGDADFVAIHDAARALCPPEALVRLRTALADDPVGGLLALPVGDTVKRATGAAGGERSTATLDRRGLWLAQTPQMFRYGLLRAALAADVDDACTDEAEAMERAGHAPRLVPGSPANFKITRPDDLALAEAVYQRERATMTSPA
ncbi:MAG: 2-C-methyl-D-erythritol 4-phosphate cytidylyltransferase [Proteobacteria bacterium]|nr:2-C-methyl-D-erythritol 4-phosphate cytidylyltransferase [Pseudomonadota bacterium]